MNIIVAGSGIIGIRPVLEYVKVFVQFATVIKPVYMTYI